MAKITRKIPATLVTQHPDHAHKPYWQTDAFINTHQESEECFRSFSELHATEYKWDWEGKLVDESVLERLFSNYYEYFKKNPLGKEKFLTFRLPNPKIETEFRIGRAFMSLFSAASLAKHFQLHTPPFFEVILPMTESAEEMLSIQEAFSQMHELKHDLYKFDSSLLPNLEIIPLFEQVSTIMRSDEILRKYLRMHEKRFGYKPDYMRPYIARSDPALNSGLVSTVLAIKIALSHYEVLEKEDGIKLYPMIGAASLPFRGGLTPDTVKQFAKEYSGIRTTTIQSAFRYDYPLEMVIAGVETLEATLPKGKIREISIEDEKKLLEIISIFEKHYKHTVESLAPLINDVAAHLPRRRERVQHVGLFGYSRGVGKVKLPRAIGFTASLYSMGIPPEIIGTGRGLQEIKQKKLLETLEKYYLYIKRDLQRAGMYINREFIESRAKSSKTFADLLEDVEGIEKYLGKIEVTADGKEHTVLTNIINKRMQEELPVQEFIEEAARIRKSLG